MFNSTLFDETTFYRKFIQDLQHASEEVVIESPYITRERMRMLSPIFRSLIERGVKIYVMTRDPKEHSEALEDQSESEIRKFEALGVQVLLCKGNHHRKLAILDRKLLWEGSLNILSQKRSREFMRRIENEQITQETFQFLHLGRFL